MDDEIASTKIKVIDTERNPRSQINKYIDIFFVNLPSCIFLSVHPTSLPLFSTLRFIAQRTVNLNMTECRSLHSVNHRTAFPPSRSGCREEIRERFVNPRVADKVFGGSFLFCARFRDGGHDNEMTRGYTACVMKSQVEQRRSKNSINAVSSWGEACARLLEKERVCECVCLYVRGYFFPVMRVHAGCR